MDKLKAEKLILKPSENLTFKISNCEVNSGLKIFYSPSFYSSSKGYCIRAIVGIEENTNLIGAVAVLPCKGDHDDTLSWPLVGEVSVTLLNQLEDRDHHTVTINMTENDDVQVGKIQVISTSVPTRSVAPRYHDSRGGGRRWSIQYLTECLYIRVSVNIPSHKSWLECAV